MRLALGLNRILAYGLATLYLVWAAIYCIKFRLMG